MKENILLVDDDPFISHLYRRKLEQEGFTVDVVVDGKTALKVLQAHQPDLILLDLMLPDVHGLQVLSVIRSKPALNDVPVIVFSSNSDDRTIEQAMRNGATRYCCKANITPPGMVQVVGETLDLRREYKAISQRSGATPRPDTEIPMGPVSSEATDVDAAMPERLQAFLAASDPGRQMETLLELYQCIQPQLKAAHQEPILLGRAQLGRALEAIFDDLYSHPENINFSSCQTLSSALSLFKTLCLPQPKTQPPLSGPLLVAALHQDDLFTHRVAVPLKSRHIRTVATSQAQFMLSLLQENDFDLVLVDREGMEEVNALYQAMGPSHTGQRVPVLSTIPLERPVPAGARLPPGVSWIASPLHIEELVLKIVTMAFGAGTGTDDE